MLELLVLKKYAECTSQHVKWTSGARVMIFCCLSMLDRSVDRSLGRSLARSVAPSVGRSLDRSLGRSVARSLARSLDRSLDRSIDRSIARSLDRSLGRSIARSLARSLGRSIARSLVRVFFCLEAIVFLFESRIEETREKTIKYSDLDSEPEGSLPDCVWWLLAWRLILNCEGRQEA